MCHIKKNSLEKFSRRNAIWLWTFLPIIVSVLTPAFQLGTFRCVTWLRCPQDCNSGHPAMAWPEGILPASHHVHRSRGSARGRANSSRSATWGQHGGSDPENLKASESSFGLFSLHTFLFYLFSLKSLYIMFFSSYFSLQRPIGFCFLYLPLPPSNTLIIWSSHAADFPIESSISVSFCLARCWECCQSLLLFLWSYLDCMIHWTLIFVMNPFLSSPADTDLSLFWKPVPLRICPTHLPLTYHCTNDRCTSKDVFEETYIPRK